MAKRIIRTKQDGDDRRNNRVRLELISRSGRTFKATAERRRSGFFNHPPTVRVVGTGPLSPDDAEDMAELLTEAAKEARA